ncbi:hypothetical protein SAMD00019534_111140 [Acytostelium subglobosum LB1]|uniref:hypothetical protein n=1 Tax=Acytostelium subglobosum LB1 TaxID=1410327 RepID=UPI000644B387|nr:hypothetical protein SAMD00019534_111140 [Acytostelium subglobosum LB1]GAM27938.1 hypothetical protein SAMD00019534_111140 [Acytostelium subglobosum LB1]|eukprot:XP_012749221.1 hypothetical protein SAMD00019534_111140 [Acytostelium subglobosum LB1]
MIFQQATSDQRELYGGAIHATVPIRFIDVAQIRRIPDHQELLVDDKTDQSIIIELLERQEHVPDDQSIQFHFNVVADESDVAPDKRLILNQRQLTSADMPHFANSVPKYILKARQMVAKFNETAENTVNVYMAIIRLERCKTDLLITYNEPVLLAPNSSSVNAVGGTVPSTSEHDAEQLFIRLLSSIKIVDYSLFQNQ